MGPRAPKQDAPLAPQPSQVLQGGEALSETGGHLSSLTQRPPIPKARQSPERMCWKHSSQINLFGDKLDERPQDNQVAWFPLLSLLGTMTAGLLGSVGRPSPSRRRAWGQLAELQLHRRSQACVGRGWPSLHPQAVRPRLLTPRALRPCCIRALQRPGGNGCRHKPITLPPEARVRLSRLATEKASQCSHTGRLTPRGPHASAAHRLRLHRTRDLQPSYPGGGFEPCGPHANEMPPPPPTGSL